MTRLKRNSTALATAQERAAGMRSIQEQLDFGGDLNLPTYDAKIAAIQAKLTDYNNLLGTLDKLNLELNQAEADLKAYSGKMLACVGARYGKTSWEYGEAGGTNSPKRGKNPAPVADAMPLAETDETVVLSSALKSKAAVQGLN
jgi:hypothetical protein